MNRPRVGEVYIKGPEHLVVATVDDEHVICTCPACKPGIAPCEESRGRGHVFTRAQFEQEFSELIIGYQVAP